jgi:hypothetical protein
MKKFISIFVILIVAAFVAFNFYAAHRAKKQINKFLQENLNSAMIPVSVHYSNVKTPPFTGKIKFSDVTFKSSSDIIKMDHLQLRLGYINLFRFYVSKTENALKHTSSADIVISHLKFVNNKIRQKYSVDSTTIHQHGNLWDAVMALLKKRFPRQKHSVELTAKQLQYKGGHRGFGTVKSDSAYFHYIISGKNKDTTSVQDSIRFSGLTWLIPRAYQEQFGFFLKGLGLSPDSVNVAEAGLAFSSLHKEPVKIKNGVFKTDPLTLHFKGLIRKQIPWQVSKFNPLSIKVVHISNKLKSLLSGFGFFEKQEQGKNHFTFRLVGPMNRPQLKKG